MVAIESLRLLAERERAAHPPIEEEEELQVLASGYGSSSSEEENEERDLTGQQRRVREWLMNQPEEPDQV